MSATPAGAVDPATREALGPAALPAAVLVLFTLSGFTALIYEVLWMKQLGLLFGNTAQAAATTLAAFFLGLAAGGYAWGRHFGRARSPLRVYALLELGVAASAVLYFFLLAAYQALYAGLYEALGADGAAFTAIKFLLAVSMLFPPAFFMGGTLPVLTRQLVPQVAGLGRRVPLLYGLNTLGAAGGAYLAGFHLPPLLGYSGAYLLAMALTALIALGAWWLARGAPLQRPAAAPAARPAITPGTTGSLAPATVTAIAFASGFVTLALEVLWTRMFAQVLQNSVYTFAMILVLFLLCLGLGSLLAARLARLALPPLALLSALLLGSALLVASTPHSFLWVTQGMDYLGGESGWWAYVGRVFGAGALVLLAPTVALGTVFPYLMRLSEAFCRDSGRAVGDLVAVNTLGAIAGSVCAGFALLPAFGLWSSLRLLAGVYLVAVAVLAWRRAPLRRWAQAGAAASLAAILWLVDQVPLAVVRADAAATGERVHAVWEGSAATVAVVEQRGSASGAEPATSSLRIKVNNFYTLGGTGSRKWEEWQAHLPLLLHPRPRQVFFLGMGTGITAGAALSHPLERVVVAEILPEAVTAAREYFAAHVNGLFSDPRARVVAEDGRNHLLGTRERFDVIVADLFMPWKAGTASLYTREHYAAARGRLAPGGLFAQWLPLYQMSAREFGTVARTMAEVFPQLTLWRGDFFPSGPTVLLLGQAEVAPLDPRALSTRLHQLDDPEVRDRPLRHFVPDAERLLARPGAPDVASRFLLYYAGNLGAAPELLAAYPINTDEHPVIEYQAPISERSVLAGDDGWLAGRELLALYEAVLRAVPPENDPYLARFESAARPLVEAGKHLFAVQVMGIDGDSAAVTAPLRAFSRILFGQG